MFRLRTCSMGTIAFFIFTRNTPNLMPHSLLPNASFNRQGFQRGSTKYATIHGTQRPQSANFFGDRQVGLSLPQCKFDILSLSPPLCPLPYFSRVHATLQPAPSVGRSVCPSVGRSITLSFFASFLVILGYLELF